MGPLIEVSVHEYYGRITIKVHCETGRKVCELLKQKTLTKRDVELLKELGFNFKIIQEVLI